MKRLMYLLFGLLISTFVAIGAAVTLAWDPNVEPDIAGYRIYYGNASRGYTIVTNAGNVTNITITNLTNGMMYYFAATAYNTSGLESDFSNEVSYTVPGGTNTPPSKPGTVSIIKLN